MKKLILTFFIFILSFGNSVAYDNSIMSFINSPSFNEIKTIKDKKIRLCEEIFLRVYMRREFSNVENKYCSDVFAMKIEAEMNYKNIVLGNRGIY